MSFPKKNEVIEDIEIVDTAEKGKSVGKHNGAVIFIPEAIPGDVVDVKIKKRKKSYLEGQLVQFKAYSQDRVMPFCQHFWDCGGCKWQHMTYEAQVRQKQKLIEDNLHQVAGLPDLKMNNIIPAPNTQYYRNRLDFAFSNSRWLTEEEVNSGATVDDRRGVGLHVPGRFDRVVDIEHCYLQKEPSNKIRLALRDFGIRNHYSFYDNYQKQGLFRSVIIRTSSTGDVMVIMMFGENQHYGVQHTMEFLTDEFSEITSLYYVINEKANDTHFDLDVHLFNGLPYLRENINGLEVRIGPKSFFQTNSEQTPTLFDIVADYAALQGHETVYDLYTGVGSIALYLASKVQKVIGIEEIDEAIDWAETNAKINQIDNVTFTTGQVEKTMDQQFWETYGKPDVVVLDPPRAGMHPKVVQNLLKAMPEKIVYVSCNPATQARDLQELKSVYDVLASQPVDMFPHTNHVENVLKLQLKAE